MMERHPSKKSKEIMDMHKNNHCGNREGRRIFRKPAAALAAAALLVSLAACSGGEQASSPSASPEGSASMGEMTLAETGSPSRRTR